MNRNTVIFVFFIAGTISGLALSQSNPVQIAIAFSGGALVFVAGSLIAGRSMRESHALSYDGVSQLLFREIMDDIDAIKHLLCHVDHEELAQQIELICQDTVVLLRKVSEKVPETRISAGKFIRGNLEFIRHDILPQYIEMQETPRYYETPAESMAEGRKAISAYARFLNRQIANLEMADDMRYRVAIDMLQALEKYSETAS